MKIQEGGDEHLRGCAARHHTVAPKSPRSPTNAHDYFPGRSTVAATNTSELISSLFA
jgi:hypothetical protein